MLKFLEVYPFCFRHVVLLGAVRTFETVKEREKMIELNENVIKATFERQFW